MKHKIVGSPLTLPDGTTLPLSRATKAGGFLFLSGQLGIDQNFKIASGIVDQTRLCFDNIRHILEIEGMKLENIVKTSVWLTDIQLFQEFNLSYAEHFTTSPPPARSTVCSALAIPGALVEIEAIAYNG